MPIRRVIDLSMPLDARTPFYPGDPEPRICAATTIAADGFNVARLELGSHSGTHCDAPYHFLADGARLDALPLERFVGPGVVVDATGLGPRTQIGWERIEPHAERLAPGAIVLLRTGWDAHRATDAYFDHPFLDGDAAERVVAAGVRTVALDALSLDETVVGGEPAAGFPAHLAVLGAGGVIVENLRGLDTVRSAEPVVSVLPLRIAGADGAPVRAIAFDVAR
jgi:kynurenine formamidase